ncbi:MAG TPA: rod shape-determining protein MreD, partial [Tepidisphaeraceae bacterium]|nr:rod shape-determining protein MreD [Tepidisphaeraceae bacterium]
MRWISYFLLAYIALGCQVALGGYMEVKGAAPNLVLLVVIFITVNAPREAGLLGAFLLGAMQDLMTIYPLGTWAVAYALVAMFVISTQEYVYREHPLTHFSLALSGGVICGVFLTIHGWVYPKLHGAAVLGAEGEGALRPFTGLMYTAILGPIVLGILQRMKRTFAFKAIRRM